MTRARDIANFGDGIATADIGDGQITTAKIADGATGPKSVQVFTSNGTYTLPDGIGTIIVEVVGGGGGGACTDTSSDSSTPQIADGGGAGGYARKLITSPSASYAVTVGTGGAGQAGSGGAGTNGGTSSFGAVVSATGGTAGQSKFGGAGENVTYEQPGGTGSGGDINISGGRSTQAFSVGSAYSGSARAIATVARGGDSMYGKGAGGGTANPPGIQGSGAKVVNGLDGTGYGSGGGGTALLDSSNSSLSGGDGADGIVIVWEFK